MRRMRAGIVLASKVSNLGASDENERLTVR